MSHAKSIYPIGALMAFLALASPQKLSAQTDPPQKAEPPVFGKGVEDPAHEELRGLFKKMLEAYNNGKFDELATYLDEDVVITWQNAAVSKTPKGVKAYFDEMMGGPNRRVQKVTIKPVVEELTRLYGKENETGVAFGSSEDYYLLNDGMEFTQTTRWTATVVRKKGQWKVACVHISTNMFDNPVLNIAIKKTATWTAILVGIPALLVGALGMWLIGRRRGKPEAGTTHGPA